MKGEPIPVQILMRKILANLPDPLCEALEIEGENRTVGLISTDCDDATYIALDAATKAANVQVAYAKSMYAGAANASTGFAGEVIGILVGPTPSEVSGALDAAAAMLEEDRWFRSVGKTAYLSYCVSRSGTYLSAQAGVPVGEALAYLVAPPVEAVVGLDAAMKAADVEMSVFFAPPTETNFAGGLLHGTQSACQAACEAFADAVAACAENPLDSGGEA